jgi:hypothetical protein
MTKKMMKPTRKNLNVKHFVALEVSRPKTVLPFFQPQVLLALKWQNQKPPHVSTSRGVSLESQTRVDKQAWHDSLRKWR